MLEFGHNSEGGGEAWWPGNLPNPGIEPRSPAFQADALTSEPRGKPGHSISPL